MNETLIQQSEEISDKKKSENSNFLKDVLAGLTAKEKYLYSKYFYDENGDKIFQQIMACPEYYLTRCEMEIFTHQTSELAAVFTGKFDEFDVIELGAGDATKSIHLLKELVSNNINFTYCPVDISKNVINLLHKKIPEKLPSLQMQGLNGEYFQMLEKVKRLSNKKKVVLFLGGNIGNVPYEKAKEFCDELRSHLTPGDVVLIGFDLKKDPRLILDAYNDKQGYTRDFNLNLLVRINEELGANFKVENFYHYPTYSPADGACKSYLVSKLNQEVYIEDQVIFFAKGEAIFTEISQKYTVEQINNLAIGGGFTPLKNFYDSKNWFLDTIWQVDNKNS